MIERAQLKRLEWFAKHEPRTPVKDVARIVGLDPQIARQWMVSFKTVGRVR
jgi:transposase-like protein